LREVEASAAFAIALAKQRAVDVGPDQLLLGALHSVSRFGIVRLGDHVIDLEDLGLDWLHPPQPDPKVVSIVPKLGYSEAAIAIFDLAALIARTDGSASIRIEHMLAAFANASDGLAGELKRRHGLSSADWRLALARPLVAEAYEPEAVASPNPQRDYLTPEEAAEALGIHVQTLRSYVRSGKLPALRLAGERALRIRRTDLEAVLEPLVPQTLGQSMAVNQT
jgi:excisionase family DNA binding protein